MTYSRYKRAASFLLALVMIFTLLPEITPSASAADGSSGTLSLSNSNLGLSYTTGTSGWNSDNIIVSWKETPPSSLTGSATGYTNLRVDRNSYSTLTIKNNYTVNAKLSFDYSLTATDGTLKIDGTASTSGSYEKTLSAGGTTTIYIESSTGKNKTISVSLTNIQLIPEKTVSVTFQPAENGSYTVNGNAAPYTYSGNADGATFALAPTPASGYKFACWYDVTNQKYLSRDASANITIGDDCTVTAKFVKSDAAMFQVGTNASNSYYDLNDAVSVSGKSDNSDDKTITLVGNGTLYGNYTIPSGITLLIPFNDAHTLYTTKPACIDTDGVLAGVIDKGEQVPFSNVTPYRKLTMASGSSITVNGAISVSAMHSSQAIGGCVANSTSNPGGGAVNGQYGYIYMNSGSNIYVNNGAKLYCWGYISGDGMVEAMSGSTVYEYFQIRDFRGGTATSSAKTAKNSKYTFFFSQYYIQNIEARLRVHAGANEELYTSVWATSKANSTGAKLFGSNALFNIKSGYVDKKYDPITDMLEIEVGGNGNVEINSITVTLADLANVDSGDYILPMTSSFDITLKSGSTATINKSLSFLPGSKLTVDEGATLNVGNGVSLYFYTRSDWLSHQTMSWTVNNATVTSTGYYCHKGDICPVRYSPTRKYTRTAADLVDAELLINGTVNLNNSDSGGIYTTNGYTNTYANIHSNTTNAKVYIMGDNWQDGNTYQIAQGGDGDKEVQLIKVSCESLVLKNADNSTVKAAGGTTYYYDAVTGTWSTNKTLTLTFVDNFTAGSSQETYQTIRDGLDCTLDKNTFAHEDFKFTGWSEPKTGKTYEDGGTINTQNDGLTADFGVITLYAMWERTHCYLTFEIDEQFNSCATASAEKARVEVGTGKDSIKTLASQHCTITDPSYEIDSIECKDITGKDGDNKDVSDYTVTVTFKKKTFTVTVDDTPKTVEYGGSVDIPKVSQTGDYDYSVVMSVTVPEGVTVNNTATGYTISNVTSSFTVTTNKLQVKLALFDKDAYGVNPNGKNLVVLRVLGSAQSADAPETGYSVDGKAFYWSARYEAFVMFADANLNEKAILSKLTANSIKPESVNYDGDVSGNSAVTSVDAGIINDVLHGRDSSAITDLMRLRMDIVGNVDNLFVKNASIDLKVDTQDIRQVLYNTVHPTAIAS